MPAPNPNPPDFERLTRNRPSGMTAKELDDAMQRLKVNATTLGKAVGAMPRTVYGWRMGDPIPAPCAILIRLALISDDARRKLGLAGSMKRRRLQFELHKQDGPLPTLDTGPAANLAPPPPPPQPDWLERYLERQRNKLTF